MTNRNSAWVLLGVSVVISTLIVAWWAVMADHFWQDTGSGVGKEPKAAIASSVQTNEIIALRRELSDLDLTVRQLKDSINLIEGNLERAGLFSDASIERDETHITSSGGETPRIAGTSSGNLKNDMGRPAEVTAVDNKTSAYPLEDGKSLATATSVAIESRMKQQDDPAVTATAGSGSDQAGTWVINLATLSTQKQAENLISKAGMKGFGTTLQHVNIEGKEYWRVQVAGLTTLETAKSLADAIKQRLGLNEVWITSR